MADKDWNPSSSDKTKAACDAMATLGADYAIVIFIKHDAQKLGATSFSAGSALAEMTDPLTDMLYEAALAWYEQQLGDPDNGQRKD